MSRASLTIEQLPLRRSDYNIATGHLAMPTLHIYSTGKVLNPLFCSVASLRVLGVPIAAAYDELKGFHKLHEGSSEHCADFMVTASANVQGCELILNYVAVDALYDLLAIYMKQGFINHVHAAISELLRSYTFMLADERRSELDWWYIETHDDEHATLMYRSVGEYTLALSDNAYLRSARVYAMTPLFACVCGRRAVEHVSRHLIAWMKSRPDDVCVVEGVDLMFISTCDVVGLISELMGCINYFNDVTRVAAGST